RPAAAARARSSARSGARPTSSPAKRCHPTTLPSASASWTRSRGVCSWPGRRRRPISYVATDDLARLAELALKDARQDHAVVPIGGPRVTYRELLPILPEICGRELRFERLDVAAVAIEGGAGEVYSIDPRPSASLSRLCKRWATAVYSRSTKTRPCSGPERSSADGGGSWSSPACSWRQPQWAPPRSSRRTTATGARSRRCC